jgi:hypothetical protein
MIKKTIKYVDYNGNEREEDFYFNINKAEAVEMQAKVGGELDGFIKRIIAERDAEKLVGYFKDLILMSYGRKSLDGRRFEKSKELSDEFSQTEAFPILFMELAEDSEKAAEFVNGILPKPNN